jgi:hypothetical protein
LQYHSVESIRNLAQAKGADNFLNWLSGFSDAESTFFINVKSSGKTGRKIEFQFRIGLHIDDIDTLKQIQLVLSQLAGRQVGSLAIYKLSVVLVISNFSILRSLIKPIFNAYPLRSAKYFDFTDWEKAINIKSQAKVIRKETLFESPSYLLSLNEIEEIIKLKNCMNDNRDSINLSLLPQGELNPYWILGFSEGESSFTVQPNKNFSPRFAISQHKKSRIVLELINKFFLNLPFQVPNNLTLTGKAMEDAQSKSKLRLQQTDFSGVYSASNRLTVDQLLIIPAAWQFHCRIRSYCTHKTCFAVLSI